VQLSQATPFQMRLTLGLVLVLTLACGRSTAIRPVDSSVSSLDDEGDPM